MIHIQTSGFPLGSGDFHSHNIFITKDNSEPRITAIIDWELSTKCTSSFAQYPLSLLTTHNGPIAIHFVSEIFAIRLYSTGSYSKRNVRRIQIANSSFPEHSLTVRASTTSNSAPRTPYMFTALYPQLFAFAFGDEKEFSGDYYWALMKCGILREVTKQFDYEVEVWHEVKSILRDELADQDYTRTEFLKFATQKKGPFLKEARYTTGWNY